MAEPTFDSLKDFPRCPKADSNGIQEGTGGNLPDRKYVQQTEIVDWNMAGARMAARASGKMARITGGLDDEDPALYHHRSAPPKFGKTFASQKGALTPEQVERLKAGKPEKEASAQPAKPVEPGPRHAVVVGEVSSSGGGVVPPVEVPRLVDDTRDGDLFVGMGGPAGKPPPPTPKPVTPQVVYRDRVVEKPVEKIVEKVVEKVVEKPAPWEEWIKKRVRVEIGTADTTFHISAVDVISSGHGITVLLPTDGGAMTFTPKIGSNVTIGQKDKGTVMTRYTGVCFELEALNLFGLCFLIPPNVDAEAVSR